MRFYCDLKSLKRAILEDRFCAKDVLRRKVHIFDTPLARDGDAAAAVLKRHILRGLEHTLAAMRAEEAS